MQMKFEVRQARSVFAVYFSFDEGSKLLSVQIQGDGQRKTQLLLLLLLMIGLHRWRELSYVDDDGHWIYEPCTLYLTFT